MASDVVLTNPPVTYVNDIYASDLINDDPDISDVRIFAKNVFWVDFHLELPITHLIIGTIKNLH